MRDMFVYHALDWFPRPRPARPLPLGWVRTNLEDQVEAQKRRDEKAGRRVPPYRAEGEP